MRRQAGEIRLTLAFKMRMVLVTDLPTSRRITVIRFAAQGLILCLNLSRIVASNFW